MIQGLGFRIQGGAPPRGNGPISDLVRACPWASGGVQGILNPKILNLKA